MAVKNEESVCLVSFNMFCGYKIAWPKKKCLKKRRDELKKKKQEIVFSEVHLETGR